MPNNPESGGISKSIEGKSRDEMREKMRTLEVPKGMGVILRTAGEGVSFEELKWDLDYLLNLWDAIQEANQLRKAPFLIYRENDLVSRSLRDFLREDITEVLIDTDDAYDKAYDFTSKLMPDFAPPIAGPQTVNFTSMVLARDKTSYFVKPFLILVPPPAAPPRKELITTQPIASVSESCHSKTISGDLASYLSSSNFINEIY